MKPTFSRSAALVALGLSLAGSAVADEHGSGQSSGLTTSQEVREEISDAFDAVGDYAVQQRKQALARAEEAMTKLDAELARRQEAMREAWAGMSDAARAEARATMRNLRAARNTLGERYGALQAGADEAWSDLTRGFSEAWSDLSANWAREEAQEMDGEDMDEDEDNMGADN